MMIASRPELPCDSCIERLLAEAPDRPNGPGFQAFSYCDHRHVIFNLKQSALGQQWVVHTPATPEQFEEYVRLQHNVNRAQREWIAANMPAPKLQ